MQRELSESIKIVIELAITAMVITLIVTLGSMSRTAEGIVARDRATKAYLQDVANLYRYNNKIINGSDVVDCIVTYARVYEFDVIIGDDLYKFNHDSEMSSGLGLDLWSVDTVESIITADNMSSLFTSNIIRDKTGQFIEGIRFEMEG